MNKNGHKDLKTKPREIQDDPAFIKAVKAHIEQVSIFPKQKVKEWINVQKSIPIRKYRELESLPARLEKKAGKTVFIVYAQDMGRQAENFEKSLRRRTIRYLINQSPPMLEKSDWNDEVVSALMQDVDGLLSELDFLIKIGKPTAAVALGNLARETTKRLIAISSSHAEELRLIAQKSVNWPILKGFKSYLGQGSEFIKAFEVGSLVPFSEEMSALISKSPHKNAMRIALELLVRLEDWRTRDGPSIYWTRDNIPPTNAERDASLLPPFSKDTWTIWFESVWSIIMESNADQPENDPILRKLGSYRERHAELTTQPKPGQNFSTSDSNIRDGIRERLKSVIKSIAGFRRKSLNSK